MGDRAKSFWCEGYCEEESELNLNPYNIWQTGAQTVLRTLALRTVRTMSSIVRSGWQEDPGGIASSIESGLGSFGEGSGWILIRKRKAYPASLSPRLSELAILNRSVIEVG